MPSVNLKDIKTASFWAREYRVPVFWLTTKKWFGGKAGVVSLYRGKIASFKGLVKKL